MTGGMTDVRRERQENEEAKGKYYIVTLSKPGILKLFVKAGSSEEAKRNVWKQVEHPDGFVISHVEEAKQ